MLLASVLIFVSKTAVNFLLVTVVIITTVIVCHDDARLAAVGAVAVLVNLRGAAVGANRGKPAIGPREICYLG